MAEHYETERKRHARSAAPYLGDGGTRVKKLKCGQQIITATKERKAHEGGKTGKPKARVDRERRELHERKRGITTRKLTAGK